MKATIELPDGRKINVEGTTTEIAELLITPTARVKQGRSLASAKTAGAASRSGAGDKTDARILRRREYQRKWRAKKLIASTKKGPKKVAKKS